MLPILIRRAQLSDLPALYRICHATGWNGSDASPHVSDPDLIGHVYAGPYAVLEPELAFVAEMDRRVIGYVLGTSDSVRFHAVTEAEWFLALRARYALPEAADQSPTAIFVRALHRGHPPPASIDLARYPAHLHIDLLPQAQGHGCGRRLIDRLRTELSARQVPGVHLYVGSANPGAIAFYQRVGFSRIDDTHGAFGYGCALDDSTSEHADRAG